jgi:hypothetical protein
MSLSMMRNIILGIGWPILIIGSIYIFVKGSQVYNMVKGSLIGKITKTLVYTMLVEMYSLGIVSTAFMFYEEKSAYLILPIFLIWFVSFIATIKVIIKAEKEAKGIAGEQKP